MSTPIDTEAEREKLESTLLVDTVRITRPTGTPQLDPSTGLLGSVPAESVYEGPGAVLSGHGQVTAQHVLGREWLDDSQLVSAPHADFGARSRAVRPRRGGGRSG
jgi:hypothetical protein